jgi:hypothetical protein
MEKERETMTEGEFAKAVGLSRVTLWRMRQRGSFRTTGWAIGCSMGSTTLPSS